MVPLGKRNEDMSSSGRTSPAGVGGSTGAGGRPRPRRALRRRASSPRSKLLVVTSLLALSLLTACSRGCHRKPDPSARGGNAGATPGGNAAPAPVVKPPPGVQPAMHYVEQRLEGGRFIAALPPPEPAPMAAAPPLPDLPPLNKHAHVPTPRSPAGNHPCGAVQVGDDVIPLDCMDPDYAHIEHATKPLVSYHELHGGEMQLPPSVDHRAHGTEGAVRAQGPSICCTAMSLAAAVDHSFARWTGQPGAVSVMQIWGRYHSPSMGKAKLALELPVGAETDWPFDLKTANSWSDPRFCQKEGRFHGGPCGQAVDHNKMSSLSSHAVAVISDISTLLASDTKTLKAKIAAGQDIWFGAKIGMHLSPKRLQGAPGARYIPDFAADAHETGGHAMLLSGYATFPHSTYFLIHNSWGPKWGDGGYAWIHEETLKKVIHAAFVVDAQPAGAERRHRMPRKHEHTTCGSGLLPDSISAECVPPCPDGGPRHNAVCPVPDQCAKGYVNLTGSCVRSAPTAKGHDKEGLKWTCGASGCAYVVPSGMGGCTGTACEVSCPAPDYRLAHGHRGLTCVE